MGYTSSKVKARWNAEHYDSIAIKLPKGSRDELNALARKRGMSTTQFLRWAVLQAASADERAQMPTLAGQRVEDTDNGYIQPFTPPPAKLIDRFFLP